MLEIRNLVKEYKAKGGVAVRALDGVSLQFAETGMVFLLGKSGSGKSTLLNLSGGLDTPDEGEIIIKGRSSKDFTQADFDSYRNTFIGFIFQEYNVLDEFSVEDNIALALELQGKNKNREQVLAILRQVEMEAYASRKPNTLSGGQKQRVAIARALVKNPEIIMADEPTGALDSNTGKQVFDTLKKLSESKLVIVVSHDREFAEIYGDRIIELKDGKIISDVSKSHVEARKTSENLRFIGDNTVSVQNGAALTDADMRNIRDFLARSQGNVFITNGAKEITDFRKAAHIDENDARETFLDTKEQPALPAYDPANAKFIRSRLPVRHAIRIGASSMKLKPIRLLFTILLSLIAFTMFGLFSTFTFYNEKDVLYNTYLTSGYDTIRFEKQYNYVTVTYENGEETYRSTYVNTARTPFTPEELNQLQKTYGDGLGIFDYSTDGNSYNSMSISNTYASKQQYYVSTLYGFAELPADYSRWQDLLVTDTDLAALGDKDVVISTYLFDSLKESGLQDNDGKKIPLNAYQDIVGKTLQISTSGSNLEVTVKGVFRYDLPQEFDELKENFSADYSLRDKFSKTLRSGIYLTPLVSPAFYEANKTAAASAQTYFETAHLETPLTIAFQNDGNEESAQYSRLAAYNAATKENVHLAGGRTTLAEDEIVPDVYRAFNILGYSLFENFDKSEYNPILHDIDNFQNILQSGSYWDYNTESTVMASDAVRKQAFALFDALYQAAVDEGESNVSLTVIDPAGNTSTFTLAGFYFNYSNSDPIFAQSTFDSLVASFGFENSRWEKETNYVVPADAKYCAAVFSFPSDTRLLRSAVDGSNVVAEDDSFYILASPLSDSVSQATDMLQSLQTIFMWVGIVMAVFSMLLLFNFISVSITNKKKEIGILRAVGARSADVFKIFFSESAIISGICFVLAMIATFVTCFFLNQTFMDMIGASILVFGPVSWLILFGIAAVTSFIATFLPVLSIARKKPVESIRAL